MGMTASEATTARQQVANLRTRLESVDTLLQQVEAGTGGGDILFISAAIGIVNAAGNLAVMLSAEASN